MYNKQVTDLYVVDLCGNFGSQRGFFSVVTLFGLRMKKLLVFSHIVMMAALNSIKPIVTKVVKADVLSSTRKLVVRDASQFCIERVRLGMGQNNMGFHRITWISFAGSVLLAIALV